MLAGCSACVCGANISAGDAASYNAAAGECAASGGVASSIVSNYSCVGTSGTVGLNASMASRMVTFPRSANVSDALPLVLLSAANALNDAGVAIVVATASACAAFNAAAPAGSAPRCDTSRRYLLASGVVYYYRGTAAELGMEAAPPELCGA